MGHGGVFLVLMNALVWWSVWNEKREEYNHHSFPRQLFVDLIWGLWSVGTYFLPQLCKCEYTYSGLGKEKMLFGVIDLKNLDYLGLAFTFFSRFLNKNLKYWFESCLFSYIKSLYISHMYCLSWKSFTLLYFYPWVCNIFFLCVFAFVNLWTI